MILVDEGQSPIILCLPHSGTDIPPAVANRLNATGRLQTDLSWRLESVLGSGGVLDATVVRSTVSRYVIDLDRDADPANADSDALCPVKTLDDKNLYQDGEEPGRTETEQRVLLFYAPFHKALHQQIDRLSRRHKHVVVVDCQSMRSNIRGVTDKGLPLVSIGTRHGQSCDEGLRNLLVGSFNGEKGFTTSIDENVIGQFISRTYGRPDLGRHVISLTLAQRAYLRHESPPFEPDKARVRRLKIVLEEALSRLADWAVSGGGEHVFADRGADMFEKVQPSEHMDPSANLPSEPIKPLETADMPTVSTRQLADVEEELVEPLKVAE